MEYFNMRGLLSQIWQRWEIHIPIWYISVISFLPIAFSFLGLPCNSMSKQQNSSDEVPATKRSRKAAGFCLARPVPASQPSASSNASLFITVMQVEERCGILKSRPLSNNAPGPTIDTEAQNDGSSNSHAQNEADTLCQAESVSHIDRKSVV